MWRRQCLSEIRAQPWRNGQGVTRLIAEETTSGAGLQWRLSVADILNDAPFSRFPGWWRHFAILSQGEVALSAKDKSWCHRIKNKNSPIEFSGDKDVLSACSAGGVQALNLMIKDEKDNVKKSGFYIQNIKSCNLNYFLVLNNFWLFLKLYHKFGEAIITTTYLIFICLNKYLIFSTRVKNTIFFFRTKLILIFF